MDKAVTDDLPIRLRGIRETRFRDSVINSGIINYLNFDVADCTTYHSLARTDGQSGFMGVIDG